MEFEQQIVYVVGSVLLSAAGLIGTASVAVHARVRWWASEMGRHLMAYMTVIAAVLDLGAIRFITGGDTWWFALLRTAVFAAVPVVLAQRLRLQLKAQRTERAARRQTPPETPRKATP